MLHSKLMTTFLKFLNLIGKIRFTESKVTSDPDPDPNQNDMDPKHCLIPLIPLIPIPLIPLMTKKESTPYYH